MRIYIVAFLIAASLSIQLVQNKSDRFPKKSVWPSHHSSRDRRHVLTNEEVNSPEWFQKHTFVGDNFITIPGAYRIHYHDKDPDVNDGKLVSWKTNVQEIAFEAEAKAEDKIWKDKKEIKDTEKSLKKNIQILKKVEKLESQPLDQNQAKKAAELEEKVIDQINKSEKKIDDLKADIKEAQLLKKTGEELEKIAKKEDTDKKEDAAAKPKSEGTKQINEELKEKKALDEVQQKMASKVIAELKKELPRQNELRTNTATLVVGAANN
jgi:hypothetical protein